MSIEGPAMAAVYRGWLLRAEEYLTFEAALAERSVRDGGLGGDVGDGHFKGLSGRRAAKRFARISA